MYYPGNHPESVPGKLRNRCYPFLVASATVASASFRPDVPCRSVAEIFGAEPTNIPTNASIFRGQDLRCVMSKFESVTVVKAANIYFDGKVTSRTVEFADGSIKTLGIMLPGEYKFNTGKPELMEIQAGQLNYCLSGETQWHDVKGENPFTFRATRILNSKSRKWPTIFVHSYKSSGEPDGARYRLLLRKRTPAPATSVGPLTCNVRPRTPSSILNFLCSHSRFSMLVPIIYPDPEGSSCGC